MAGSVSDLKIDRMHKTNSFLLWTITVVITVSVMIYQRMTGPTYPKKVNVELDGKEFQFKLLRSNEIGTSCDIDLEISDPETKAILYYKLYKADTPWMSVRMQCTTTHKKVFFGEGAETEVLRATLPEQPPAGKIAYYIDLLKDGKSKSIVSKEDPVILRFKGYVPRYVLVPHILFMIISLFTGTRAGVEALFGGNKTLKFTRITLIVFGVGGLILGPVVQKYAFGEFWTGWPFGGDWTDNKTIFAWLFWLVALFVLKRKPENRFWPVVALTVFFAMYLIPHSMGGSELDHNTGKIETGIRDQ